MKNAIAVYAKSTLPQFTGNYNYNEVAKMFLTSGYMSAAGNIYQSGLRLSQHLAVQFSIGHGYCHSFLNGITVFIWDKDKPKVISQRSFSCFFWNEYDSNQVLKSMIKEYVLGECRKSGIGIPTETALEELAVGLIKELETETSAAAKQLSANVTKKLN
jgi:hypothetical protein